MTVIVTSFTRPKPIEELKGLVWGMAVVDTSVGTTKVLWWQQPKLLGFTAVGLGLLLTVIFF